MRNILLSETVESKIVELKNYLVLDLKLSETAALRRMDRIGAFLRRSLGNESVNYRLCRFVRWRALSYRCVQTGGWVFAYETFEGGVIVRDMAHGAALHGDE